MSKHQHLISKYHFSFSGIGPKTKTRNWWKVFKTCRIPIKTSLTLSKEFKNLLKYTGLILRSFFTWVNKVPIPNFLFEKKFKREE